MAKMSAKNDRHVLTKKNNLGQTELWKIFRHHCSLNNTKWKLRSFVLATDSFSEEHIACNIVKSYDNVIEKFKLA